MSMNFQPRIEELTFGIRNPRTIKIYPLSIADQIRLGDKISDGVKGFFTDRKPEEIGDLELLSFVLDFVNKNLNEVLPMLVDMKEPESEIPELLKEMTNDVLVEIVRVVIEVNYWNPVKKVVGLLNLLRTGSDFGRPPQSSSDTSPATDLSTSTGDPTRKGE